MKLLKTKFNKSLWRNEISGDFDHNSKKMIGVCLKNDIMLYLNDISKFNDADDLNKENFLYYVFHPKYGACWLWADNETDVKWLTDS
jgi:hypothetical protein